MLTYTSYIAGTFPPYVSECPLQVHWQPKTLNYQTPVFYFFYFIFYIIVHFELRSLLQQCCIYICQINTFSIYLMVHFVRGIQQLAYELEFNSSCEFYFVAVFLLCKGILVLYYSVMSPLTCSWFMLNSCFFFYLTKKIDDNISKKL